MARWRNVSFTDSQYPSMGSFLGRSWSGWIQRSSELLRSGPYLTTGGRYCISWILQTFTGVSFWVIVPLLLLPQHSPPPRSVFSGPRHHNGHFRNFAVVSPRLLFYRSLSTVYSGGGCFGYWSGGRSFPEACYGQ